MHGVVVAVGLGTSRGHEGTSGRRFGHPEVRVQAVAGGQLFARAS